MRKEGIFRKAVIALAFAAFLSAGYMAASVATARKAEAQMCAGIPCIVAGSFIGAIQAVGASVAAAIDEATAQLTANFTVAINEFVDTIGGQSNSVTQNIIGWFDTFWHYNLLPGMQTQTDQLTTTNTAQNSMSGSMNDAENQNDVQGEIEKKEVDAHKGLRPSESAAMVTTIVGGLQRADTFRETYNTVAPVEKVKRSANETGSPSSGGKGADIKNRWDEYVARYCEKDDNNGHAGCEEDAVLAGKDVDVTGMIFMKDTIDLKNDDIRKTVDDLITNIAEPLAKNPVSAGAIESATGQQAMLAGEAYKAKRQVIYDALYHTVARRAPGSGMGAFLAPFRLAAGIKPSQISANPSYNEVMQVMLSERFRTGKYGLSQVDEIDNNARELVIQQAFQMMHMSDQLDMMDRYALLLAAEAGTEVRAAKKSGSAAGGAALR